MICQQIRQVERQEKFKKDLFPKSINNHEILIMDALDEK